jgi:protein-L-isoaspartate(D-aspartate) O-methyltransferase
MPQDPSAPLRRHLVEQLAKSGAIRSPAVARAITRVPRHLFVPGYPLHHVYADRALVTKARAGVPTSSSSEPGLMANMLEMLRVRRGMNVLEIGAGTGYNAALLAELVGPEGTVTAIDIQRDVTLQARRNLRRAGYENARVVRADGARGMPADAPFDRIVVTAGCWEVTRSWRDQLAPNGIIVLPLRLNAATALIALRRRGDDLVSFGAAPCGFMPMEGRTGRRARRKLARFLYAAHDYRGRKLNLTRLEALLRTTPRSVPIEQLKLITRFPASSDFSTFLALQGEAVVALGGSISPSYEFGIVDTTKPSLCLISPADAARGEAIAYGTDDCEIALRAHLAAWFAAKRPAVRDLRIRIRWRRDAAHEIPQPSDDGTYRFARAGASFTAWYEG